MRYVVRRLEFFVITLWAALTINFILPRLMPGDPVEAMMAHFKGRINPEVMKALRVLFGVNTTEPLPLQYVHYLGNLATGNLGTSFTFWPNPVSTVIAQSLPWTLGLIGLATVISFALGTLIGMLAAWRRGGVLDGLLPPLFVLVSAFPYFWIGLLFLYVFSLSLNLFPSGSAYDLGSSIELTPDFIGQVLSHAFLPALTIVVTSVGGWILTMRNNMLTTLTEDYIKMARAKGLSPLRIMLNYAGRNAILPNLTGFAMSLGFVISGALLVEIVFTYPGVGFVLLRAVENEDYPLMQALFLLITLAVLVAVLASDLLTALLDPRTRERT